MSTTAIPDQTPTVTAGKAKQLAREMFQGGWKVSEIQRYLERNGIKRHYNTVRLWVDDDWAAKRHKYVRAYQREWFRGEKAAATWDNATIDHAVIACRREGMSHRAIATAMKVLAGVQIDHREVSRRLRAAGIA